MNPYQKSIELLNKALGSEIATSLQYMYFHTHCEDKGYRYLATMFRNISIQEMRHIEVLSDRILFLGGDCDMNAAFRTQQVCEVEGMLDLSAELEGSTIRNYNAWGRACSEANDIVSGHLFQVLAAEEETHQDHFQLEQQNMQDYGKDYLVLQSFARSRHENRHEIGDWEKEEDDPKLEGIE